MKKNIDNLLKKFTRVFGISFFYIDLTTFDCQQIFQKKHHFDLDLKQLKRQISFFDTSIVNLGFLNDQAIFGIPLFEKNEAIIGVVKINKWVSEENNFITKKTIKDIIKLLYLSIYDKNTSVNLIRSPKIRSFIIEKEQEDQILKEAKLNINDGVIRQSYQKEKEIINAIQNGDVQLTKKTFESFRSIDFPETKPYQDEVRHKKNMLISVVPIATRAAIEGGLAKDIAYTMSDHYIREIEQFPFIPDSATLYSYVEGILTDYAEKVARIKRQSTSGYIFQCQQIIYLNIYGKLTVEDLATKLALSKNYLSSLFKKKVGCTIKEYILQQKIAEAQFLLLNSSHSFQEISTMLHFSNQSHFINVFKKQIGMTPKQYKDINQLAKE
ncbi:helix-turn-helix domain-containing protein [Enterococcus rivorum]|uniref:HTH araC/xylS-type domain-containing protein n=1 Tax=Enterococcus rivorum TaxID=762845 RepID=A0A1E5KS83_9ENTE|nr:helix-turn-helix domain-containing protein [Enterococcus rivorum]MBP2097370.1 AraC-like DNA-binding protein [Enterococcus rivorum]OEH80721.1 hypothetical protein BCR26_06870 [Enterococcus rivorum]